MTPPPIDCSAIEGGGEWSELIDWASVPPALPTSEGNTQTTPGVLAVHAMLTPTGEILAWRGRLDQRIQPNLSSLDDGWKWFPLTAEAGGGDCGVPTEGGPADVFCAGHVLFPDGRIAVVGGNVTGTSLLALTCAFELDPLSAEPVPPPLPDEYNPFDMNNPPEPVDTEWTSLGNLTTGRWYPTVTVLADGTLMASGGIAGNTKDRPEVYLDGQWQPILALNQPIDLSSYPFMFVLPDGNVLYAGSEVASSAGEDKQYNGRILEVDVDDVVSSSWTNANYESFVPGGSAVMYRPGEVMKSGGNTIPSNAAERIDLSLKEMPGETDGVVEEVDYANAAWGFAGFMHDPRHFHNLTVLPDGRVLATGGNRKYNGQNWHDLGNSCDLDGAPIIDIACESFSDCPPVLGKCRTVRDSGECSEDVDCDPYETCLPDLEGVSRCTDKRCYFYDEIDGCEVDADCPPPGECVAGVNVNFCRVPCDDNPDCPPVGDCDQEFCNPNNNACFAVKHAELWDPESNQWCQLAAEDRERMYHSTALLLPDGRVVSMGNGQRPGLDTIEAVQVFSPPYLLTGEPRPVIVGISPASPDPGLTYDTPFQITIDPGAVEIPGIRAIALIKLGSATHGNNMEQRYVPFECWTRVDDATIELTAPASGGIAPPGYYMLFLVSDQGVPSIAEIVRIGP